MGDAVLSLDDEEVARALAEQKEASEKRARKKESRRRRTRERTSSAEDGDAPSLKKEEKQRTIVWPKTSVPVFSETVKAHCWSDPDSTTFKVRGPNYLKDKVKIQSKEAAYKLVGVDLFLTENRMENVCKRPDNFVQLLHSTYRDKSPFIICANFILPWGNFIAYWTPRHEGPSPLVGDPVLDRSITNFVNGDDEYRSNRWKFIPRMIEGNFIVKRTVGETPAIIGKKLTHSYYRGNNYLEVQCDVTSSSIARGILAMVHTYTKSVVIDLVFMLEPQSQEELPERILGGVRFHKLNCDIAPTLALTPYPSARMEYAKQVQAAVLAAADLEPLSPTTAAAAAASS